MEEQEIYQDSAEELAVESVEPGESETPEQIEGGEETAEEIQAETPAEVKKSQGVQKRIDELVKQRETEKREKEYWRTEALRNKPPETAQPIPPATELPKPRSDQFDNYDDFMEAIADWKAETKVRQIQTVQQAQSRKQAISSWHEKAAAKYDDWREVFTDAVDISQTMGEVMLDSDHGVDLGYHLAKNPGEARRIFNLPAHRQAYEMGKLEAKLINQPPPQKNKTNAPAPTSPVGGKEVAAKKLEDMSQEEYNAYRKRQMAGK
jgi:hypothetical protein